MSNREKFFVVAVAVLVAALAIVFGLHLPLFWGGT
jgi:hypothetical protein